MLRYSEGFDYAKLNDSVNTARVFGALKWFASGGGGIGAFVISSTTAFGIGRSLQMAGTSGGSGRFATSLIGTQMKQGFFGCRLYLDSGTVGLANQVIQFRDSITDTVQFTVRFMQYGVVALYRGTSAGTLIGHTEEGAFLSDVWFYFELGFIVDDTGGRLEVRINTVTKAEYEDIDTQVSANDFVSAFTLGRLVQFTSTTSRCDDIYVTDTVGDRNNGFLGNVIVRGGVPAGAGDSTEWNRSNVSLANWQNASNNEVTDALYVYNDVEDELDLYTVDPIFTSPQIFGISLKGFYRQDDGTQMFANNVLKSGSTVVDGDVIACMSTYGSSVDIFEDDPDTGMAWTPTAANLIQIGPRVAGEPT